MAIFPATLRRLVIALNGMSGPEYFQAGDSSCKPGMIVMEDDADEVKVCTSTGKPIGVVGCDADHDLGTVYTAGERIPIWMLGCGVDIYILCSDATTITVVKGGIIDTADDTTLKGTGRIADAMTVSTTTEYVHTLRNSTFFWIGKALETGSITSAIARYVPVKLSF